MKKTISVIAMITLLLSSGCIELKVGKRAAKDSQKTLSEIREEKEKEAMEDFDSESEKEKQFETYYSDGYDEGYEEGYRRAKEDAYKEEEYRREKYPEDERSAPSDNNTYLFPSDRYYITEEDLRGLSQKTVALMRNEIYARHGYIFSNYEYHQYFSQKSWYYPNQEFTEDWFNDIEKANKSFIVNYEKRMGWR